MLKFYHRWFAMAFGWLLSTMKGLVILQKKKQIYFTHNIIRIHNSFMWDWQYYMEYSIIHTKCEEYLQNTISPTKYCYKYEYRFPITKKQKFLTIW